MPRGSLFLCPNVFFQVVVVGTDRKATCTQTGLFSAVLAALVVVSVQDIRPNPQDTSAFYLEKMYELQADPNASRPSVPSPLAKPPAFSPPRYAIWVNSLWFLSLVISLTCAMLATLLQQWARRYIRATQLPRCSPEKRARMHAFFANGVKKFHADWAVEALPASIHLSLLTFFAGLLIFLHNVNHTVFSVVLCGVAFSSAVYACITLMPIFWLDSPYYAPLSSTVWLLYATIWYTIWKVRAMIVWRFTRGPDYLTWYTFTEMKDRCRGWILGGLGRATEEMVSYLSSELDSRVVDRTVDALSEDDDLEKFFECLPSKHILPGLEYGATRGRSRAFAE